MQLEQARCHFSNMDISERDLNSTAFARDDSVHFSRRIIHVDVLGYKYVVGLKLKAIPAHDRVRGTGFAEQLVRHVLPNEIFAVVPHFKIGAEPTSLVVTSLVLGNNEASVFDPAAVCFDLSGLRIECNKRDFISDT